MNIESAKKIVQLVSSSTKVQVNGETYELEVNGINGFGNTPVFVYRDEFGGNYVVLDQILAGEVQGNALIIPGYDEDECCTTDETLKLEFIQGGQPAATEISEDMFSPNWKGDYETSSAADPNQLYAAQDALNDPKLMQWVKDSDRRTGSSAAQYLTNARNALESAIIQVESGLN